MPDLGSRPPSPLTASSLTLVALGISLTMIGRSLDGFTRGLVQGGGVAIILIGVIVLSAHFRRRKETDKGLWLPSRDEDKS